MLQNYNMSQKQVEVDLSFLKQSNGTKTGTTMSELRVEDKTISRNSQTSSNGFLISEFGLNSSHNINDEHKKRSSRTKSKGFYITASSSEVKNRFPTSEACTNLQGPPQSKMEGALVLKSKRKPQIGVTIDKLDHHSSQEEETPGAGAAIATDPSAPLSPSGSTTSSLKQSAMAAHQLNNSNSNSCRFSESSCSSKLPTDIADVSRPTAARSQSSGWQLRDNRNKADNAGGLTMNTASGNCERTLNLKNTDTIVPLPNALQIAADFAHPKNHRKLRVVKKLDIRHSNSDDKASFATGLQNKIEQETIERDYSGEDELDAIERLRKARRKKRMSCDNGKGRSITETDKIAAHNLPQSVSLHKPGDAAGGLTSCTNYIVDRVPVIASSHSKRERKPKNSSSDDDSESAASFGSSITSSVQSRDANLGFCRNIPDEEVRDSSFTSIHHVPLIEGLPCPGGMSPRQHRTNDDSPSVPLRLRSMNLNDLKLSAASARKRFDADDAPSDEDSMGGRDSMPVKPEKKSSYMSPGPLESVQTKIIDARRREEDRQLLESKDSTPLRPEKKKSVPMLLKSRSVNGPFDLKDAAPVRPIKKPSDIPRVMARGKLTSRQSGEEIELKGSVPEFRDSIPVKPTKHISDFSTEADDQSQATDTSLGPAASPTNSRKTNRSKRSKDSVTSPKRKISYEKEDEKKASDLLKLKIAQINEIRLNGSGSTLSLTSNHSERSFDSSKKATPRRCSSIDCSDVPETKRLAKEDNMNESRKQVSKRSQSGNKVGSLRTTLLHAKSSHLPRSTSCDDKQNRKVRSRSQSPGGKGKRQPKSLQQSEKLAPWQIKQHRVAPVISLYNVRLDEDDKEEPEEDPNLPPAFRNKTKKNKMDKKKDNLPPQLDREKRRCSTIKSLGTCHDDVQDLPPAFRHLSANAITTRK